MFDAVTKTVIPELTCADGFTIGVQCLDFVFFIEQVERDAAFANDFGFCFGALSPAGQGVFGLIVFGNLSHAIRAYDLELLAPSVVLVSAGQGNVFISFPVNSRFTGQLPQVIVDSAIGAAEQLGVATQRIGVLAIFFKHSIKPVQPGTGFNALNVGRVLHCLLARCSIGQCIAIGTCGLVWGVRRCCFLGYAPQ